MLKNKTLFIVGAGASKEFGLPIGHQLAEQIAKKLYFSFDFGQLKNGDAAFLSRLQRGFSNNRERLNEHLVVARKISEGIYLTSSIDNFIDIHRHDERISTLGKACIVDQILTAERSSTLFFDKAATRERIKFSNLVIPGSPVVQASEIPWIVRLIRILIEGVPLTEVSSVLSDLMVISFNYDRCIQHCLSEAIGQVYGKEVKASEIAERLNIVYPYGTITHDLSRTPLSSVEFGADPNHNDIVALGRNIKTFTEQVSDEKAKTRITDYISKAETIVILGFAYHPQNLELLNIEAAHPSVQIFGTALGFSDADTDVVRNQLRSLLKAGTSVTIRNDLSSTGLLREYGRTLSRMVRRS